MIPVRPTVLRTPEAVLGLLVLATILTTWVLSKDAADSSGVAIAVLAIAAWKVRLVLLDFMELREAPLAGRLLFEGWIVVVAAGLAALVVA